MNTKSLALLESNADAPQPTGRFVSADGLSTTASGVAREVTFSIHATLVEIRRCVPKFSIAGRVTTRSVLILARILKRHSNDCLG